jgi:hypothetical protein
MLITPAKVDPLKIFTRVDPSAQSYVTPSLQRKIALPRRDTQAFCGKACI